MLRKPYFVIIIIVALCTLSATGAFAQGGSCSSSDYVPCLKESIEQKQQLIEVYKKLAEEYGKFYYETNDKGEKIPLDVLPRGILGGILDDKFLDYLKIHSLYSAKEKVLTDAIASPPSCHYDTTLNLQLSTHILNCKTDIAAANVLEMSVPCRALYELAFFHEGMHINACLARSARTPDEGALLLTPAGKAKEEIKAYEMEIEGLSLILDRVEHPKGKEKSLGHKDKKHPIASPK